MCWKPWRYKHFIVLSWHNCDYVMGCIPSDGVLMPGSCIPWHTYVKLTVSPTNRVQP